MPSPPNPAPGASPSTWPLPWPNAWTFADAAKEREAQDLWAPSRAAEREYERRLLSVAGQVKTALATTGALTKAEKLLREYAKVLEPWARQSAANMLAEVERKNAKAWRAHAKNMGLDLRALLGGPGIGELVRQKIEYNAGLIESLPLEAAQKAVEIAEGSLVTGSRAEDIAKRIAALGEVSMSRARTIARTEVSKANTALIQARSEFAGGEGYIWRCARNARVRPSHGKKDGEYIKWDEPQLVDGMTGHAGEFPNCQCRPEPVVKSIAGRTYTPALSMPPETEKALFGKKGAAQYIKFERSDNLAQAAEFAEKMNMRADYSGANYIGGSALDVANYCNEVLAKAEDLKLPLPSAIRFEAQWFNPRNPLESPAAYHRGDDKIVLNPNYPWHRLEDKMKEQHATGHASTASKEHIMWHELAHAAHAKANPQLYADIVEGRVVFTSAERAVARKVSGRAAADPLEFVAEVSAAKITKKSFARDVMDLYKKFGGM